MYPVKYTILDTSTNEISIHNLSKKLKLNIVTDTINKLVDKVKEIEDYIDYSNRKQEQSGFATLPSGNLIESLKLKA